MPTRLLTLSLLLLSAFGLCGCGSSGAVTSAAENGFRKDIKVAGQVVDFKKVKTVEQGSDGKAVLFYFESTVRWLTFDEAVNDKAHPQDPQAYVDTIGRIRTNLLSGAPKLGTQQVIQGAALIEKTDLGWNYKGLVRGR